MKNNKLSDIHQQTRQLDQICQKVNKNQSIEIPTGVGCCMYIRRTALEATGYLNNTELQRGYGEEVDLCLRFSAIGWKNYCATNIFIAHIGGLSFKQEKRLRVIQNLKVLNKKYPNYEKDYQSFLDQNCLYSYRKRIEVEQLKNNISPYTLIIAPNRGYQALSMQKYRFDYAASRKHLIYLYKNNEDDENYLYLCEDQPMGYANLRYVYPKDKKALIQHLNLLKIKSIIDHSDASIKKEATEIIKQIRTKQNTIKYYCHKHPHLNNQAILKQPNQYLSGYFNTTNIRPLNILVLPASYQNKNYEVLLNLARYIAFHHKKIRLLKVGNCIGSRTLINTGCVRIVPKSCLSNEYIAEFLSAAGIDLSIDLSQNRYENYRKNPQKLVSYLSQLCQSVFKFKSDTRV